MHIAHIKDLENDFDVPTITYITCILLGLHGRFPHPGVTLKINLKFLRKPCQEEKGGVFRDRISEVCSIGILVFLMASLANTFYTELNTSILGNLTQNVSYNMAPERDVLTYIIQATLDAVIKKREIKTEKLDTIYESNKAAKITMNPQESRR